jgi:outer membrane protein W
LVIRVKRSIFVNVNKNYSPLPRLLEYKDKKIGKQQQQIDIKLNPGICEIIAIFTFA